MTHIIKNEYVFCNCGPCTRRKQRLQREHKHPDTKVSCIFSSIQASVESCICDSCKFYRNRLERENCEKYEIHVNNVCYNKDSHKRRYNFKKKWYYVRHSLDGDFFRIVSKTTKKMSLDFLSESDSDSSESDDEEKSAFQKQKITHWQFAKAYWYLYQNNNNLIISYKFDRSVIDLTNFANSYTYYSGNWSIVPWCSNSEGLAWLVTKDVVYYSLRSVVSCRKNIFEGVWPTDDEENFRLEKEYELRVKKVVMKVCHNFGYYSDDTDVDILDKDLESFIDKVIETGRNLSKLLDLRRLIDFVNNKDPLLIDFVSRQEQEQSVEFSKDKNRLRRDFFHLAYKVVNEVSKNSLDEAYCSENSSDISSPKYSSLNLQSYNSNKIKKKNSKKKKDSKKEQYKSSDNVERRKILKDREGKAKKRTTLRNIECYSKMYLNGEIM